MTARTQPMPHSPRGIAGRAGRLLAMAVLALSGCPAARDGRFSISDGAYGTHPHRVPFAMRSVPDIHGLGDCAAEATVTAKGVQQENGRVLSLTLWNYHFETKSSQLHPSGISLLNQILRNQTPGEPIVIYLATAHDQDLNYNQDQPSELVETRNQLDSARAKAVTDYVTAMRPGEPIQLRVHDPKVVGMSADEALVGYQRMLESVGRERLTNPAANASGGEFGSGGSSPGAFEGGGVPPVTATNQGSSNAGPESGSDSGGLLMPSPFESGEMESPAPEMPSDSGSFPP